jgi:hypothetical protein
VGATDAPGTKGCSRTMNGGVARRLRRSAAANRAFTPPPHCGLQAEKGKGKDRRSAAPASNQPLEVRSVPLKLRPTTTGEERGA